MKKFLLIAVLASTSAALAQTSAQQPSGQSGAAQSGTAQAGAPQPKTIKDPSEYNAYMTATTQTDPNQKAAALEAFVQQYPNSVVKEDALEEAMAAYQAGNNAAKASEVADRLLQANPNNLAALTVEVYSKRMAANQGQNAQQNIAQAGELANRGLQALQSQPKPAGVSDEDWKKRTQVFTLIFDGAAGQAALDKKDFPTAQKYLLEAAANNTNDFYDNYFAGVAALSDKTANDQTQLAGLWNIARAVVLSNNAPQVVQFGQFYYKKYHGSMDGWDQLVAQAKASAQKPADLAITKYNPPSPAQQAADMIQKQPDVSQMDTGSWIFILGSGNQQAADQVWNFLHGKALKFVAKVVETGEDKIGIAMTADGFQSNTKEAEVTMTTPYKVPPKVGDQVDLQAVSESYTPTPFLLVMDQGIDLSKAAAKPAAKKRPVGKKHPVARKRAKRKAE